ncbi:unnamed protein product [Ambrosiozyma monospora]|uniref:dihydrolipoyllysine-residue succinyltransferase n=1 Tax=Ambrosiozyma monospora TaxID=43982 RepID=A0A9W7DDH1_AMBMO|nr:unnamed protein product [Ambrosiozyma monospora]
MLRNSVRTTSKTLSPLLRKQSSKIAASRLVSSRSISFQSTSRPALVQNSSKQYVNNTASRFLKPTQFAFIRGEATAIKVPDMAESITEGTLASFAKEVGEYVEQDELIATIETDKIDVEVNAPFGGIVKELLAQPDDTVVVGQDLIKIEKCAKPEGAAAPKKAEEPKKEEAAAPAPAAAAPTPASEAPKKAAPAPTPAPKKATPPPAAAKNDSAPPPATGAFSRHEERIKMNRMRLRIAERLKEAQNTAASLTTFNEVDMSALMEMRKLYKDEILKQTGTKFGFMGAFSKASALAMKNIPAVNGAIENGDTMVYRDYVDLSIAVATPKGLVTPIVRNVESLSILEIEDAIAGLGRKARDGKLTLEDMAGGTFTISNGGVFGSLYGTPIINMPQTAVLGLHGIKQRPVTVNGKIESRPMMYIALTYDHRMLDGREAVTFLRTVKELIEDPRKMLLV